MQAFSCIQTSLFLLLNPRTAPFPTFATGEEETLGNLARISHVGCVNYRQTCLCTKNRHEF